MKRMLDRIVRGPAVLVLLLGFVLLPAMPVMAQDEQPVTWQSYDVTIEVREDGSLRITETILIEFHDAFGNGERTIPMDRIESIEGVTVSVGPALDALQPSSEVPLYLGEPGTFSVTDQSDEVVIRYGFPRTSSDGSDAIRAVEIAYTATGVIRDYPNTNPPEQQVRWTAVSGEITETGSVESASATVIFPGPIPRDRLAIDPAPASVEPDRVTWRREQFGNGDALQVAVAFPPVTDATAPAWQADADRYEGRQEHLPAIAALIGMVALVTSVVTILLMVTRGLKDPEVGLVADIIPNRPDDLPAALVGTLIDESVDTKDVLAGLLDLDRRGFIRIYEDSSRKKSERYRIDLLRPIAEAPAWDQPILEGLFTKNGKVGTEIELGSSLKDLRMKSMSGITKAWERELFERGYFVEEPGSTRMRWVGRLLLIALAFALAIGLVSWWAMKFSGWMAFPITVAGVGLIIGLILTTKAAVKSTEGAIVAAKWRAYGRYVQQLKKGPSPERFFQMLEQDLPWAVALGFDSSWTKLADEMTAQTASERRAGRSASTVFVGGFGSDRHQTSTSSGGGGGGGGGGGLQGASAQTLAAIGGGSAGMFAMLNDAAASFNAGASSGGSSGGGFSGSSSVGSSGGGGHSFS